MAQLHAGVPAGFEQRKGEAWESHYQRQTAALDALTEKSSALPEGEVVGALLKFQIADGYAYYLVIKDKPLTLQHIPFGDAYRVDPALIRGLRRQDVLDQVLSHKHWAKLFAARRAKA